MSELWRLLLLVTLSASAVTFVGSAAIWFMDEERRIRRALRHVLKGAPETVIVAKGRGRGAGFNFTTNQAAVAWDSGAWCLLYRIDELMGAELSVDGQVIGRVFRGEPRRAIDQIVQQAGQVTLKLIFDDPRHPDFELDLWLEGDQQRRESRSPADAIQEANRWLLRADAIVRRPLAPKAKPAPARGRAGHPVPPARRRARGTRAQALHPGPRGGQRRAAGPSDRHRAAVRRDRHHRRSPGRPLGRRPGRRPAADPGKDLQAGLQGRTPARNDQDELPFDLDD
jgi:hypothetical protein